VQPQAPQRRRAPRGPGRRWPMGQGQGQGGCSCCGGHGAKELRVPLVADAKATPRATPRPARESPEDQSSARSKCSQASATPPPPQPMVVEEKEEELTGLAWAAAWGAAAGTGETCDRDEDRPSESDVAGLRLDARPRWMEEPGAKPEVRTPPSCAKEPLVRLDAVPSRMREQEPLITELRLDSVPSRMRGDTEPIKAVLFHSEENGVRKELSSTSLTSVPEAAPREGLGPSHILLASGCLPLMRRRGLSRDCRQKIKELFDRMDTDGDGHIEKVEAQSFFGKFSKVSTSKMFSEIDTDDNEQISVEEFLKFWEAVRKTGYRDAELREEIDVILEGGAWRDWQQDQGITRKSSRVSRQGTNSKLA